MQSVESKCALITGVSGFVGSRLVRQLMVDGWNVHGIVRPQSDLTQLDAFQDSLKLHTYDGSTEGVISIIRNAKPTVVFHLASMFISEHMAKDVSGLVQSNVLFAVQLLEGMKQNGVEFVVNAGTVWQHYESSPDRSSCLYAATKSAFENILSYYVDAENIRAITVLITDTYGPNDPRRKIVPILIEAACNGNQIDVSPGTQKLDLVHVRDIAFAFSCAAELVRKQLPNTHCRYVAKTGIAYTIREIAHCIELVTGKIIHANWGARPFRRREPMCPPEDSALQKLPTWVSKTSIESGFREIVSASVLAK